MASFNSSDHNLTAEASDTTMTDDRTLTILYGTLGTVLALMSLMVAALSFLRPNQQQCVTGHRDEACEDESRCEVCEVAHDDRELQNHPASNQRHLKQVRQEYHNTSP